jgi:hypothetical protein
VAVKAADMKSEETHEDASASRVAGALSDGTLSRRQAIGRMSAFATAGAAAWVVPEILTARSAGGATLSGPALLRGGSTALATTTDGPSTDPGADPSTAPGGDPAAIPSSSLAYTGLNIQRDAEIGAALVAGGWAMHHWASRTPTPQAGSSGNRA